MNILIDIAFWVISLILTLNNNACNYFLGQFARKFVWRRAFILLQHLSYKKLFGCNELQIYLKWTVSMNKVDSFAVAVATNRLFDPFHSESS